MNTTVKTYLQPAFVICVVILFISAAGMSVTIKSFGVYLQKEPCPLRKSLDFLDESGLGPYKVISKDKIKNKDVLKALGTQDYIQWIIEDSQSSPDSAVRLCLLFVTYYELPDRVPHVPEECYTGSGYQKLSSEVLTLRLDDDDSGHGVEGIGRSEISVRYLIFGAAGSEEWWTSSKFPILYLFRVNGEYTNSREGTRIVLNKNIFGKYSYFSKVEWKFFNFGMGEKIYPNKEEAVKASQKLLKVILPVLEEKHWPQMPLSDKSDKKC